MEHAYTTLERLKAEAGREPCVSIYFSKPDRRLSDKVTTIELYRRLAYARRLLETSRSRQEAADYVQPLLQIAKDELLSDASGTLALFKSGDVSMCLRLPQVGH